MPEGARHLTGQTVLTNSTSIAGINNGADMIRWNHTPDDLQKLTESTLADGEKAITQILKVPKKQKTYANTIAPFAKYESDQGTIGSVVSFYSHVSPD